MVKKLSISTRSRTELIDITPKVAMAVRESNVSSGLCTVFVPHTTAAVTINENADRSVKTDILTGLERAFPADGDYEHSEGNSAAHIKSTVVGTEKAIIVENGELKLGTWQGIFFCEFDGPRQRNIFIRVDGK